LDIQGGNKLIQKIRLLHYLSEHTYKRICDKVNLIYSPSQIGDNFIAYPEKPISRIQMFNINYKELGHIWFMHINVDFPKFNCAHNDFESRLYESYNVLFDTGIMSDFPIYDQINCDYIEYSTILDVNDAKAVMSRLSKKGCVPEQLDKALWEKYKKAHGTIEFCLSAIDGTHIETLTRCHGTALKKRISNTDFHRATGITPTISVNIQTENEIVSWLRQKYNI
jgi:hypothetical protein